MCAFVAPDCCFETSTSTGTGTINLGGAVPTYRTLVAGVGSGNLTDYRIADQNGGPNWEVGRGIVTAGSPDTLSRPSAGVWSSSNAGALVNFTAGTKDVYTVLAGRPRFSLVVKPGDESRNTTTTLAPDTDLKIDCLALTLSTPSTMGLKYDLNFTGTTFGADVTRFMIQPTATVFSNIAHDNNTFNAVSTSSGNGHGSIYVRGRVSVNAAGTFSFRWAQNSSNATNATVVGGSYLQYTTF